MRKAEQVAPGGPGVYVRVCRGNAWAGMFLYRMAWLCAKAKIEINGKKWFVHSRDQAMAYWGCSKWTYDLTMRFLRENGQSP
jgi:hypothetical protein